MVCQQVVPYLNTCEKSLCSILFIEAIVFTYRIAGMCGELPISKVFCKKVWQMDSKFIKFGWF